MNRDIIRIYAMVGLLLLSYYVLQDPIFREFDVSEYEGEEKAFYFTKIIDSGSSYTAEIGFSKNNISVISDAKLSIGEVVSFYGVINNGRLYVEKYKVHEHPYMVYYLSIVGLFLFIILISRR